jgi:hypothetical protein
LIYASWNGHLLDPKGLTQFFSCDWDEQSSSVCDIRGDVLDCQCHPGGLVAARQILAVLGQGTQASESSPTDISVAWGADSSNPEGYVSKHFPNGRMSAKFARTLFRLNPRALSEISDSEYVALGIDIRGDLNKTKDELDSILGAGSTTSATAEASEEDITPLVVVAVAVVFLVLAVALGVALWKKNHGVIAKESADLSAANDDRAPQNGMITNAAYDDSSNLEGLPKSPVKPTKSGDEEGFGFSA